jgi:hypothetical protein
MLIVKIMSYSFILHVMWGNTIESALDTKVSYCITELIFQVHLRKVLKNHLLGYVKVK